MTITSEDYQGEDEADDSALLNPYGVDLTNLNPVHISPEKFKKMMLKKEPTAIPYVEVLAQESESFEIQFLDESSDSSTSEEETNGAGGNIENMKPQAPESVTMLRTPIGEDTGGNIENIETKSFSFSEVPLRWQKYIQMQKAGVPLEGILQLARVMGKTPTQADVKELKEVLGLKSIGENDDMEDYSTCSGQSSRTPTSPLGYPPPQEFQKFLVMKKEGITKEAILQIAYIQGFNCSKLERWLNANTPPPSVAGSPADSSDMNTDLSVDASKLSENSNLEITEKQCDDDNKNDLKLLSSISITLRDQEDSGNEKPGESPKVQVSVPINIVDDNISKTEDSNDPVQDSQQQQDNHKSQTTASSMDTEAPIDHIEKQRRDDYSVTKKNANSVDTQSRDNDEPKFAKYVKMREKGIAVGFVLEAARNQFISASEITELERILAEVQPTKSTSVIIKPPALENTPRSSQINVIATHKTGSGIASNINNSSTRKDASKSTQMRKFNQWFTPIAQEAEEKDEENETVAFHQSHTSPLASLVRRIVDTIEKRSRGRHIHKKRNPMGQKSIADDDLVVSSKSLYHALGSFKGIQIARDNYNDTLVDPETSKTSFDDGWIRAKRQSFREIARSIGLHLPKKRGNSSVKDKRKVPSQANINGLDALVLFIEYRYRDELQESLRLLREEKLYDFESLSALYVPGSRVVAKNICSGGIDMICKVAWNRIKSGRTITGKIANQLEVCFEFVVAIGNNKATIAEVVEGIEEFQGRRNIFSSVGLTFVPLMAYEKDKQKSLLEKYRRRGCVYNNVALNHCSGVENQNSPDHRPSYSYKAYRTGCFFVKRGGFGGAANPASTSKGMASGGRIVIDSQGAYEHGNSLGVGYEPMITGIHYKLKEYKLHQSRNATEKQNGSSSDLNKGWRHKYDSGATNQADNNEDDDGMVLFDKIPEDYLDLVWPSVIGFSLTAKSWGDCLVDGLEDIQFSEDAFDRLVLPDDRKRLIKALVKHSTDASTNASRYNFQDIIKGKGEGTVFLLYGPPGVGKTLTAEAVSEVLQRPMYNISMGTLGTTADDLERRLTEILRLCAKWNAIILLDEADSFLEKRSSASSLERNAMVSVMLQLVEYFTGILFLTSNRMDSLDPAFQTRITLSLHYDTLTEGSRQKIWQNLLQKSGVVPPDGDLLNDQKSVVDTKALAKYPLNGREIKNALRLGLALASEEDRPIDHKLLMETSSLVKPISVFANKNDTTDKVTIEDHDRKKTFFWWYCIAALPCLFLLVQYSMISSQELFDESRTFAFFDALQSFYDMITMTLFQNGNDDGMEPEEITHHKRRLFSHFSDDILE